MPMSEATSAGDVTGDAAMPIAIVGIGCRFPGGIVDPESFWRVLSEGVDAITEIPADRFDIERYYDPTPGTRGRITTRLGGFVDQPLELFDASFFGISRAYAERLDPQQRLLLETAWEAMEDAGLDVVGLQGSPTGVFMGQWVSDFEHRLFAGTDAIDFPMAMGSGRYAAAGRLSYAFGFRGPSLSIDAACSSGLASVHLAVRSLRNGDSAIALAGGVNIILQPHIHLAYSSSKMLAPDGRCRFGDASGTGYVRAEGAGVVVLKPLARAIAEQDRVYAVIRGSAVNNDGNSSGSMGRPSRIGQEELLRGALRDGDVQPSQLDYVEAHGTGTRAGDPVELAALGVVLSEGRAADVAPTWVGSVKTNFGHTEAAAGVAGLIKTSLMLERRLIAPSLHFETPNPEVPWSALPLAIPTALTPWPEHDRPRYAGVSSYGIGGTNAHVVLASAPSRVAGPQATVPEGTPAFLPLSARSDAALRALAAAYADRLQSTEVSMHAVCWSAATRRSALPYRAAFVAPDRDALVAALRAFAAGDSATAEGVVHDTAPRRVGFVVPGQGAQWHGMVRELAAYAPVFREALQACDAAASRVVPWSIVEQLHLDPAAARYIGDRIDVIQPTLVAVAIAYAVWLRSVGVSPDAVVGHSLGEIGAAAIAGIIDVDSAMRIICRRSAIMMQASGAGAMAVLDLSEPETRARLVGRESLLGVAVCNSPRSTVISGDATAVHALVAQLEREGVYAKLVKVDVASHGPQMDPLVPELVAAAQGIRPAPGAVPIYSTVTGARAEGTSFDPHYWGRNLREPVQFGRAVEGMIDDGISAFVELGPHPILRYAVMQTAEAARHEVVATSCGQRGEPDVHAAMSMLATLWVNGVALDWQGVMPWGQEVVPLPRYPWQRERFWYTDEARTTSSVEVARETRVHPYLGTRIETAAESGGIEWDVDFGHRDAPWLADHVVRGSAIVPAAAVIDLMAAAAREVFGTGRAVTLRHVAIERAIPLRNDGMIARLVAKRTSPDTLSLQLRMQDDAGWRDVARGVGASVDAEESSATPAGPARDEATTDIISGPEHYHAMRRRSLAYGPLFQVVSTITRDETSAVAALAAAGPDTATGRTTLLDGALQVLLSLAPTAWIAPHETLVPLGVERLVIRADSWPSLLSASVAITSCDAQGHLDGDLVLRDATGRVLLEARGVHLQTVRGAPRDELAAVHFQVAWRPVLLDRDRAKPSRRTLVIHDRGGVGARAAQRLRSSGEDVLEWPRHDVLGDCPLPEGTDRILVCSPLDAGARLSEPTSDALDRALESVYDVPLAMIQRAAAASIAPSSVVIVTSGSVAVREDLEVVSPLQGAAWGLARVARHEHPSIGCVSLDIGALELADALDAGVLSVEESELAWREGQWWASRIEHALSDDAPSATPSATRAERYAADVATPGVVDSLGWRALAPTSPGPNDVEIAVAATGLNFLDVLGVLNAYPSAGADHISAAPRLGLECTGVVTRLGRNVHDVAVGDRVMALWEGSLGSHVIAPAALVARVPAGVAFESASGFPIAFLTAARALEDAARLRAGERVLIHSAAGGVGLAAIQVARCAGADVLATAGTPEKRALLRSMGIEHVFDSRRLDWGDEVLAATGGVGVDVVLNSLAGAAIETGFRALAPYGRFIEIGKRDVFGDTRIGMEVFRKQAMVTSVYLLEQMREDPEALGVRFRQLVARLERGELQLLPTTPWSTDALADAFRSLLPGTHVGKAVLVHDAAPMAVRPSVACAPVHEHGTYVITGGLGSLGQQAAAWLVARGARHLVFVGRSAPGPEALRAIAALEAHGVIVVSLAADIARPEAIARLRTQLATMPPLRGVLHAAGVLDDGPIAAQTPERMRLVAAAKLGGLLQLASMPELAAADFLVLYSSVAGALGTRGQANYAAANAALDAMAHALRAGGVRATSIGFGPFGGRGLAADGRRLEILAGSGIGALRLAHADIALDALAGSSSAHALVMVLDATAWIERHDTASERHRFAALLTPAPASEADQPSVPGLHDRLALVIGARQRRDLVLAFVQGEVAAVLRTTPDRVEPMKALRTLGIDSLTALELRNRLEQATALRLPGTLVFTYPNASALADHLAERLAPSRDESTAPPSPTAGPAADAAEEEIEALARAMAGLDADELQRLLAEHPGGGDA